MSVLLQKELSKIIMDIVNMLVDEGKVIKDELNVLEKEKDSIEKLGRMTELKIQKYQIERLQKKVSKRLKTSENLIVLSTITPSKN